MHTTLTRLTKDLLPVRSPTLVRKAGSTSMGAVVSALTGRRDGLLLITITCSTTKDPMCVSVVLYVQKIFVTFYGRLAHAI